MKSGTGTRVGIRYEGTAARFGEFGIRYEGTAAGFGEHVKSGGRIRYEGTAAGFGEFGLRELRRAAMKGMALADPDHRAEIQAGLRRAQIQDLRAQIVGRGDGRGDGRGPRPGGDAA